MNIKKLTQLLSKEAGIGIRRMVEHQECSHSFNLINGGRSMTVWMLAIPSRLDYPIYNALKPIIEADGKVGTLVEPNPRAPRE